MLPMMKVLKTCRATPLRHFCKVDKLFTPGPLLTTSSVK